MDKSTIKNNTDFDEQTEPTVLVERQLSFLIRRYLSNPTKSLAQAVVAQLESLLKHPDCIGYPDHRCVYKKMLQHWRAMV